MRFRKKPVVIEAVKVPHHEYADNPMVWAETPDWLHEAFDSDVLEPYFGGEDYWYYKVKTLEGVMLAGPDDMLIKGLKGELYPCKADIFNQSYEKEEQ